MCACVPLSTHFVCVIEQIFAYWRGVDVLLPFYTMLKHHDFVDHAMEFVLRWNNLSFGI